jgi:hypothetical protein
MEVVGACDGLGHFRRAIYFKFKGVEDMKMVMADPY